MDDYDIQEAFAAIEDKLIKSMMRNMARHRVEEINEEKEWAMWQAEQLKALGQYKKANQKAFKKEFSKINESISDTIIQARKIGNLDQEVEILEAIKKGFKSTRPLSRRVRTSADFFKLNDRKLNALIRATKNDFQRAEIAMLRMANDQYRKVIFNAQAYANSGATTYEKAVDMASRDFLSSGINCIEYKNGARVNVASYASMALNTASKRAYLTGEGEKRQEWGISTVIMNRRGAACPRCLPFVGKVLIDDVWSGGEASDGDYPLMSSAIAKGLYHPNCKDSHTTYFEGITTPPKAMSQDDLDRIKDEYRQEQKKKYYERMLQKYKTLEEGSLDPQDKKKYTDKINEWKYRIKLFEKGINSGIINSSGKILRIPQIPSSTISKKISNGEYSTKLSKQHFDKHTEGTKKYLDYLNSRLEKKGNPQSVLSISEAEAQEIITSKAGKGIVRVTRTGDARPVESITCDKVVGKYYANGKYHDTKKASIHYGKKVSHLVPIRGEDYD